MQQRLGLGVALLGGPASSSSTSRRRRSIRRPRRTSVDHPRVRATGLDGLPQLAPPHGDRARVRSRRDRRPGRVVASGAIDDLLGRSAVRIRATGLPATACDGSVRPGLAGDDGWLSVAGVDADRVPDSSRRSSGPAVGCMPSSRQRDARGSYMELVGARRGRCAAGAPRRPGRAGRRRGPILDDRPNDGRAKRAAVGSSGSCSG